MFVCWAFSIDNLYIVWMVVLWRLGAKNTWGYCPCLALPQNSSMNVYFKELQEGDTIWYCMGSLPLIALLRQSVSNHQWTWCHLLGWKLKKYIRYWHSHAFLGSFKITFMLFHEHISEEANPWFIESLHKTLSQIALHRPRFIEITV